MPVSQQVKRSAIGSTNGKVNTRDGGKRVILISVFVVISLLLLVGLIFAAVKYRNNHRGSNYGGAAYSTTVFNPSSSHSAPATSAATEAADEQQNKVCMRPDQFEELLAKAKQPQPQPQPRLITPSDNHQHQHEHNPAFLSTSLYERDKRVLNDQLYPPLNRVERDIVANLPPPPINASGRQEDTFRLLGYIKYTGENGNEERDAGNNTWKCMGRMKDRHSGEFYAVPANTNDDIKIPLTPDIVVSERLRDIYTLPTEMRFNSPFFNGSTYTFVELPKTELNSAVYL